MVKNMLFVRSGDHCTADPIGTVGPVAISEGPISAPVHNTNGDLFTVEDSYPSLPVVSAEWLPSSAPFASGDHNLYNNPFFYISAISASKANRLL